MTRRPPISEMKYGLFFTEANNLDTLAVNIISSSCIVLLLGDGEFKEQKDSQFQQENCPHKLILKCHTPLKPKISNFVDFVNV